MKNTTAVRLVLALTILTSQVGWTVEQEVTVPVSVISSDEVFVTLTRTTMSRNNLPTNTEVLSSGDWSAWSPQTTGEAVRRMTSIQVNRNVGLASTQNVQIRGAATDQNLILVDGRPVGGVAFSGSQDLSEIPIDAIDHFEVVRGGVSSLYGANAMGGVLNVITKRGPQDGKTIASAGYDYGSYGRNQFRATAGSKAGPMKFFMYGSNQHESGFRDNSEADTINVGGNMDLGLPGPWGKLSTDASYYKAAFGLPFTNNTPPNQFNNDIERRASTPNSKQTTDTKALKANYSVPLPANSLLSVRAWGSERRVIQKDDFVDGDRFESSHGAETQVELPYGFMVGGNYIYDRLDATDHFTPSNSFISWVDNYAFFVQETFRWNAFTVIPSGRYDHHSSFGDSTNPRVQLMASALPWLRFSGSAARSFRAPKIDDKYYPLTDFGIFADPFSGRFERSLYGGNPNIRPETAWTYDAGFELFNEVASFKATYFRANVSNLIQNVEVVTLNSGTLVDPDVSQFGTFNIGSARRQGVEIQMDHRTNDYLREGLNYTYLNNVGLPQGYSEYVVLAYSPRHTANGFLTISPIKSVDINSTVRYVDKRYSSNDRTGTKLGSMVLWDMRLAYRWNQLDLYFQTNNVTNRRYTEVAGYPLPGRTFIGGVTLHFGGSQNPT